MLYRRQNICPFFSRRIHEAMELGDKRKIGKIVLPVDADLVEML